MAVILGFMVPMEKGNPKLFGAASLVAGLVMLSLPAWVDGLSYYAVFKLTLLSMVFAIVGVVMVLKGR